MRRINLLLFIVLSPPQIRQEALGSAGRHLQDDSQCKSQCKYSQQLCQRERETLAAGSRLEKWTQVNLIRLHEAECEVLHLDQGNP